MKNEGVLQIIQDVIAEVRERKSNQKDDQLEDGSLFDISVRSEGVSLFNISARACSASSTFDKVMPSSAENALNNFKRSL